MMDLDPKTFPEWLSVATVGLERNIRQRLEIELSAHYEEAYEEFIRAGLAPEEAARRALAKLGEAQAARELFQNEYAVEMPWERPFLPKKLDDAAYGYVKGNKLIACTRGELIDVCKAAGINSTEVTLAWTPETEGVVPVETIPFLFEAIKEKRLKNARWDLLNCAAWAGMLLGPYFTSGEPSNLRHLLLFLGLATVLPGISGFRSLRAAKALTPELLAKEVAETPGFNIWSGFKTARLTIVLVILCSIVTIMQIVAVAFGGSFENAALAKSATRAGEWWRLLTCIFEHGGLQHLLFNVIAIAAFGSILELAIGRMFLPVVFLLTALSGSLFSLFLNSATSVGASGGILGLAGFLFATARHRKAARLAGIQQTVAWVACLSAITGIIAFDLFDSAAHLGGLLGGLALGVLVKDPKKLSSKRGFQIAGILSCVLLLGAAVLAVWLMFHPVPGRRATPRAEKVHQPSTPPQVGGRNGFRFG